MQITGKTLTPGHYNNRIIGFLNLKKRRHSDSYSDSDDHIDSDQARAAWARHKRQNQPKKKNKGIIGRMTGMVNGLTGGMAGQMMRPQVLGMVAMAAKPKIQQFLANMNKPKQPSETEMLLKAAMERRAERERQAATRFQNVEMPQIPEEPEHRRRFFRT